MANLGRYHDSNPTMRAAGVANKLDEGIRGAWKTQERPETPDKIRSLRGGAGAPVGTRRVQRSDPSYDSSTTFGRTNGTKRETAADAMRPPDRNIVEDARLAAAASRRNGPQRDTSSVYGRVTVKGETVSDCMSLPETPLENEARGRGGRVNAVSGPGEQVRRNYGDSFLTMDTFGVPTPMDKSGAGAKSALAWSQEQEAAAAASSRSRMYSAPEDASERLYGRATKAGNIGAAEIIASDRQRHTQLLRQTNLAKRVREELRFARYNNWGALTTAFDDADRDSLGHLPRDTAKAILTEAAVPLDADMVSKALGVCEDDSGDVNIADLLLLLNWSKRLPIELDLDEPKRSTLPEGQEDRAFGVPTIRNDLVAPTKRSVSDGQNYGDYTNAGHLLMPNQYTQRGLEVSEFTRPRPAAELHRLLEATGVGLTDDSFVTCFVRASKGADEASLEAMRQAMEELGL